MKHRDLILDDILASLARLPSSKRNLRNYRYVFVQSEMIKVYTLEADCMKAYTLVAILWAFHVESFLSSKNTFTFRTYSKEVVLP